MSRAQLALNVADLEASVTFYSKLCGVVPAKRRPGYANFAIMTPPLELVLIGASRDRKLVWTTSASRWRRPTRSPRPPTAPRRRG